MLAMTSDCRDHAVSLALRLSHHEWSPIRACLRDVRLLIFLIVVSTIPEIAHGRPTYAAKIPNGASVPAPDGSGICNGVGHKVCTGHGERNAFGEDFDSAGRQWTRELCMKDSDGDGFTNGEEVGRVMSRRRPWPNKCRSRLLHDTTLSPCRYNARHSDSAYNNSKGRTADRQ